MSSPVQAPRRLEVIVFVTMHHRGPERLMGGKARFAKVRYDLHIPPDPLTNESLAAHTSQKWIDT